MPFEPAKAYYRVRLAKPIPRGICEIYPPGEYPALIGVTGQRMWMFKDTKGWVILTELHKAILLSEEKLATYIQQVRDEKKERVVDDSGEAARLHEELWAEKYKDDPDD